MNRKHVGIALIACVALGHAADAAPRFDVGTLYRKEATWQETMLASRKALQEQLKAADEPAKEPQGTPEPVFDSLLKGGGKAARVSVDVSGWKELWLHAIGDPAIGGGHAVWGDAVLVSPDGTTTVLSSLKPKLAAVGWGKLYINKDHKNKTLRISGREFANGFFAHADSEMCFSLGGAYSRFEAWAGINDSAGKSGSVRFKICNRRIGPTPVKLGKQKSDIVRKLWGLINRDFRQESRWMQTHLGHRREYLTWFEMAESANLDGKMIEAALKEMSLGTKPMRKALEDLQAGGVSSQDRRWLDLYVKACRWRDALGPMGPIDTKTMRASIEHLIKMLGDRYPDGTALLKRLADYEGRLAEFGKKVEQSDESALDQVSGLLKDFIELRRDVRLGIREVKEHMAVFESIDLAGDLEVRHSALFANVGNRKRFERLRNETRRQDALIEESDKDPLDVALRRTEALCRHLRGMAGAPDLGDPEKALGELRALTAGTDLGRSEARYALFAAACVLRRKIAFTNPLLDFDKLLFLKRHRALYSHMCDQYYGTQAVPGGGLCVLSNPFGPNQEIRDVLADSVVGNGRLKGAKLEGGSFLSPDLSFDGKRILFAYVECAGSKGHKFHFDIEKNGYWDQGRSYHIFSVNVDGSGLTQVTDGTWNDFDPCWLPDGRVAFISERRGGYLRCGRCCPTFTLYAMDADGGNITRLSPHETNEWHPSVAHDGRIIYTRWDYIDRNAVIVHFPWITTIDGRDSRAVHGNFSEKRTRPDMELDLRAVPGSHKYVATAAPHHGQAFGSLVLIDPDIEDDDRAAPIRRITPDIGFPESQGGKQAYGTAWPLNEDFYLCVYDSTAALGDPRKGREGDRDYAGFNYGIYLVDTFGNKILVYRDPEISSHNPTPLRSRPMPAAMPHLVRTPEPNKEEDRAAGETQDTPQATVAVIDVYDSILPWPEGVRIAELRVLVLLPMVHARTGATGFKISGARLSSMPGRYVVGTAPVEDDGSAHFMVPAGKELFFQALDKRGMAIQSMRSGTYTKAGERLTCQGCHEHKYRTPPQPRFVPKALTRAPSKLTPDVDGSNPFSYPRLVQPVLDKSCVACHAKHPKKAPDLSRERGKTYYKSYESLAPKYGFLSYGNAHRTIPGKFGARASKLFQILEKGHHDVNLSKEDLHRITLWLDCVSVFYGVTDSEGKAAQLKGEVAYPKFE